MSVLTTKELQALSDQLDFEKVLHCKYMAAVQECQDGALKTNSRAGGPAPPELCRPAGLFEVRRDTHD